MKIVHISDTHNLHGAITVPDGDILCHTGDLTGRGTWAEVENSLNWLESLPHKWKIFIAGNHDWWFEKNNWNFYKSKWPSLIYLNDSGIQIDGINIWGSPVQPWFYNWAFNRHRGQEIQYHWNKIPENTDLLLVHGPPFGILDRTSKGENVGCQDLLDTINLKLKSLKGCMFGHIHEDYGQQTINDITYLNSSICNLGYKPLNNAQILEI